MFKGNRDHHESQRGSHMACFALACAIAAIGLSSLTGCHTLSLPAIDQSGNRLFAPNQSTSVVNPHDPNNGYPSTAPAYRDPPNPPKCTHGGGKPCAGCLAGKGCLFNKKKEDDWRGRCGQLLITPNRIVAPVGGEVILLAGICGKDEHLVTNEPIEWMLAPESVGQFVEVGDDAKGKRQSFFWRSSNNPLVEKLDVDFARGRTSQDAGVITKGTADRADDLPIRRGQTWISVTSPSEGTSKVTVLAPASDVWDKRRQTATIYWVDSSWDFPMPQVLTGDEPATLITKVMRREGILPATGWIVRYRSLNPEFAQFEYRSTNPNDPRTQFKETADVRVDENGVASAVLRRGALSGNEQNLPRNGSALIEVEIIRPVQPAENMPELPLARGTTTVTWSAPNLVLDAVGPDLASPGQSLQYIAKVSNVGDLAGENVIVTARFPATMRVISKSLQPQRETNDTLIWELGPLPAHRVFEVSVNVTASSGFDGNVVFELSAANDRKQLKSIPIRVQQNSLSVQISPAQGVQRVPINERATFTCVVSNTGTQTVNNVRVQLVSDPGLIHESPEGRSNDVSLPIPSIRPGESIPLNAVFRVERPGILNVTATAFANEQAMATQRASIEGLSNPPSSNSVPGVGSAIPSGGNVNPSLVPGTNFRPELNLGDPSSDRLGVRIQPLTNLIKTGDTVTYEIRIDNLVAKPDQKVELLVSVPKGSKVIAVKALGLDYHLSPDGRSVEMSPIQFFRSRDSFLYSIQLRHEESGSQVIEATARSRNQSEPISTSHNTRVQ